MTAAHEDREAALSALAGMLQVASVLVRDEPSAERVLQLSEAGLFDEVPQGFDDEALAAGFDLLREGVTRAAGDGSGEEVAALKREWLRLFAGVGQPEVPSWANFYLDPEGRVLGRQSLEVRALYAKYGLELAHKGTEPDDDLGLMLRFLSHLVRLQADGADTEGDQTTMLREHILPWISVWRYEGLKHASSAFYRGAIEFTFGLIRAYAASLGFFYKETTRSFATK